MASFNFDLVTTAQSIQASARAAKMPVAMASPPTFTLSAASANTALAGTTKTLLTGVDPAFSAAVGAAIGVHSVGGSSWNAWAPQDLFYGGAVEVAAGTKRGGTIMFPFWCDAPNIELLLLGAVSPGNAYRLWVDRVPAALAPRTDMPTDSSFRRVKVDMPSATPRLYWLELDKFIEFGGITIGANYNAWAAAPEGPRVMVAGDSYTDGTGADAFMTSFARLAGQRLGVADIWANGEGALGYVKPGSLSGKTALAKLAGDVMAYKPDWVAVCLGINDFDQSAVAVQANATAYFAALLEGLPSAGVTVFGPWRAPGLNPPANIENAIQAAVAAQADAVASRRIAYVDTYAENYQQMAGRVGAVSGSGNSNIHVGADNVHQVQVGHDYLAARVANGIMQHTALAAKG